MNTNKVNFLIKEYEKLKDEQNKRIDFRDQMIYITLGAIGGVFSFVIDKPDYAIALLVLPFVCIILGWTYLTNDERISEIGDYCRTLLIPRIENLQKDEGFSLLPSWEEFHRTLPRRKERKIIQLILDLCLFCISASFSLFAFFYLIKNYNTVSILVVIIEIVFISYLAYQFISYAALHKER